MERSDVEVSLVKYYRKISISKPAVETMTGKKWEKVPDYETFQQLLNKGREKWLNQILRQNTAIYTYLIYLRHHGFPSPLLDWTQSPYVAALFAFDRMDNEAEHVAIYVLLQDTFHSFSSTEHLFIIGPYIETHPRHYLQQSQYSLCVGLQVEGSQKNKRVDYIFRPHEQALDQGLNQNSNLIVKLKIRCHQRRAALEQLDSMNLNPFSLFGSEESLIRTVARRECLFKSWSL